MSKGRVSSCLKLLTHCAFHMWYVACKAPQFQVVFTLIVLIRSHTFFYADVCKTRQQEPILFRCVTASKAQSKDKPVPLKYYFTWKKCISSWHIRYLLAVLVKCVTQPNFPKPLRLNQMPDGQGPVKKHVSCQASSPFGPVQI